MRGPRRKTQPNRRREVGVGVCGWVWRGCGRRGRRVAGEWIEGNWFREDGLGFGVGGAQGVFTTVASRGPWWRRGSEVLVDWLLGVIAGVGCVRGLLVVMCSCGGRAQDQAPVAGREEQEQSR